MKQLSNNILAHVAVYNRKLDPEAGVLRVAVPTSSGFLVILPCFCFNRRDQPLLDQATLFLTHVAEAA